MIKYASTVNTICCINSNYSHLLFYVVATFHTLSGLLFTIIPEVDFNSLFLQISEHTPQKSFTNDWRSQSLNSNSLHISTTHFASACLNCLYMLKERENERIALIISIQLLRKLPQFFPLSCTYKHDL